MAIGSNGWTGGQYSIYRGLLALGVARLLFSRAQEAFGQSIPGGGAAEGSAVANSFWISDLAIGSVLALGVLACLALALGVREQLATAGLVLLLETIDPMLGGSTFLGIPPIDALIATGLLILHFVVSALNTDAPFGAWPARERADPAGEWTMPAWMPSLAWAALVGFGVLIELSGFLAGRDATTTGIGPRIGWALGIHLLGAIALVYTPWRRPVWGVFVLWSIGAAVFFANDVVSTPHWLFLLLAFDPAWLPGRRRMTASERADGAEPRLFYDGECGLCHRSVRLLLSEEGASADARALRFAPLQGETFEAWARDRPDVTIEALPDSIVLASEDGRVLTRSTAAIDLAHRLGGAWKAIGAVAALLPEGLRDALYDGVAAVRKSIFAKPKDSCPILPPHLRARFDL